MLAALQNAWHVYKVKHAKCSQACVTACQLSGCLNWNKGSLLLLLFLDLVDMSHENYSESYVTAENTSTTKQSRAWSLRWTKNEVLLHWQLTIKYVFKTNGIQSPCQYVRHKVRRRQTRKSLYLMHTNTQYTYALIYICRN